MTIAASIPIVAIALISLLRDSTGLIAISQRESDGKAPVYSALGVPQGTIPPYTVLRSLQSRRSDTFTSRGEDLLLTLDTWSGYLGDKQINDMHAAIKATLDEQEAAIEALLTGYKCTYCLFDTNDQLEDQSTTTRLFHGVERYRLRTEAI